MEPRLPDIVLPCELLEANGDALLHAILDQPMHGAWTGFLCGGSKNTIFFAIPWWIVSYQEFRKISCPRWQELGYRDAMATEGEPYHLWAIEAPESVRQELPLDQTGLM